MHHFKLDTWQVRGSIVVSISACHAEDPGSIPGRGGRPHFHFDILDGVEISTIQEIEKEAEDRTYAHLLVRSRC